MATIFISYREDDAKAWAVAVRDELAGRFGADEVFLDKESLQAGRWREQIEAQLAACKVFVVVIGHGFPKGRWFGSATHVWTVAEVEEWLAQRPPERPVPDASTPKRWSPR
jgi:TIR domain